MWLDVVGDNAKYYMTNDSDCLLNAKNIDMNDKSIFTTMGLATNVGKL